MKPVWVLKTVDGASFALVRFPAAIGREGVKGLAVALTDPRVSRKHAEIVESDQGLAVRDLRSRNGTFVNGRKVEGLVAIKPGDSVKIGNTDLTLAEPAQAVDTARCEVANVYDLDDHETRSVPFEALQQAAAKLADAAGQALRPEHAGPGLLYALARSVAGLREPADIVDAVVAITADVIHAEHAAIYEPENASGLRVLRGAPGGRAAMLEPSGASVTLVWRAHRLQEAVIYDARRGHSDLSVSSETLSIRSAIAVPLCVGDRSTGVLYADTRRDESPLGDVALELMGAVALQAAASLEAARRHTEVVEARRELDEANQRLREWGRELERRVHERTQEIENKTREIEDLLTDKNDLLRMVAHDLRMPLTSVVGYAQIADSDLAAGDIDGVRERLQTIHDVGRRTAYLLDDLLTAESIRSGKLDVRARPTDVGLLLERTLANAGPPARERGVELCMSLSPDLGEPRLDPGRVSQVLDNLVGNAIKVLRKGGRVDLRARREGLALVLEVEDNGPGLEKAVADRVRGPDSGRMDAANARVGRGGGFGLGLTIARKLAVLVGGDLAIDTSPEVGTRVRFRLPTAYAPASASSGGINGGTGTSGSGGSAAASATA